MVIPKFIYQCIIPTVRVLIIKKQIDVFMQQLATLVMGMLDHITISLSSSVSNICWDSVCTAVAIKILSVMKQQCS
jgi:hypothetical protein